MEGEDDYMDHIKKGFNQEFDKQQKKEKGQSRLKFFKRNARFLDKYVKTYGKLIEKNYRLNR